MIRKILPFVFLVLFGACSSGYLPGMGPDSEPDEVAAAITSFTADKTAIEKGQSVTLSWETAGAAEIILDPVGAVEAISSVTLTPLVTTTYTLSIYSADAPSTADGEPIDTKTIDITVTEPVTPPDDDGNNPPPVDDPCADVPTEAELNRELSLSATNLVLYAGEETTIEWHSTGTVADATIGLYKDDVLFSEEISGTQTENPERSVTYSLKIENCGVRGQKDISITVRSPEKVATGISTLKFLGDVVYAGKMDGSLVKSIDEGAWETLAGPRPISSTDQTKIDETPVSAIMQAGDNCAGAMFIGTKGGYVYKSLDEGKTSSAGLGGNLPLVYFTTDASSEKAALAHPSAVNFIIRAPYDTKTIYIGHANGLSRLVDCTVTDRSNLQDVTKDRASMSFYKTNPLVAARFKKVLYVGNKDGLYSTKDGDVWTKIPDVSAPVWLKVLDSKLYVGTSSKLFSFDESKWESADFAGSQALYASSSLWFSGLNDGLHISRNAGDAWMVLDGIENDISGLFVNTKNTNTLWALGKNGDVYTLDISGGSSTVRSMYIQPANFLNLNLTYKGAR